MTKEYTLDDVNYNFKPIEIFTPDPDYHVDEEKLKKSIQKSKDLIARVHMGKMEDGEFAKKAAAYADAHPYKGKAQVL